MVACISLDGFIADVKGTHNQESIGGWTSAEDKREFWSEVDEADLIVAGRRTLESMPAINKSVAMVTRHQEDLSLGIRCDWMVDPYPSYVHDFLAQFPTKRILVCGGSMTYDLFLRWNLVDHMVLMVEPVALGRGIRLRTPPPTQGGQDKARFSLIKSQALNSRGTLRLDLRRVKP